MSSAPYLALDIGERRTGLALSESGMLARPLGTALASMPHLTDMIQEVVKLAAEHQVATLIIGLPYTADGEPTGQSEKIEAAIVHIEKELAASGQQVAIIRRDEYRSTQDAAQLYPGADRDAAAAALLLQDYLDGQA